MGWFGKKEEVPEVPVSAGEGLGGEDIGSALPELPSFPGSPANESLNQEIVKSAVGDSNPGTEALGSTPSPELPSLPEPEPVISNAQDSSSAVPTVSEPEPLLSEAAPIASLDSAPEPAKLEPVVSETAPSLSAEAPSEPAMSSSSANPSETAQATQVVSASSSSTSMGTEPIFVRLDKFQDSQKIFKEIRETVTEIDSVLGKIKGVKSKEENELNGWTKEVESLKQKLSEIDSDIFSQI